MDSKEGVKVEETATAATPADGSANATNRAATASHADTTADAADEDFEEGYEEEGFEEEGMEYAEEEGYENEFAINASESETRDFDDGLEGQEEDMLEDVRTKIREMEEEADKLRQLQSDTEKPSRANLSSLGEEASTGTEAERLEVDSRSVYVGQVEYSCTIEELDAHFRSCGVINRITIMCDRFSGHPKGFAYIEFATKEAVDQAVLLNDSTLKDRQLKVIPKRTNQPGMGFAARRARRPYRGAGFSRGRRPYRGYSASPYYRGRSSYRGGFRGGSYRPRRSSRFMAY